MERLEKRMVERKLIVLMMVNLEAGFNEVAHFYRRQLFWAAHNILDNEHLAEDAVQEGLLSAYLNLVADRNKGLKSLRMRLKKMHLRAWLNTIVRNKAKDRISELRGESLEEGDFFYIGGQRVWLDFDELLEREERKERAEAVRRLIETLSPVQQEVIRRKFFREDGLAPEDVRDQQIADEMNIPLNTVKSHKRRAFDLLRKRLQEKEAAAEIEDMIGREVDEEPFVSDSNQLVGGSVLVF